MLRQKIAVGVRFTSTTSIYDQLDPISLATCAAGKPGALGDEEGRLIANQQFQPQLKAAGAKDWNTKARSGALSARGDRALKLGDLQAGRWRDLTAAKTSCSAGT